MRKVLAAWIVVCMLVIGASPDDRIPERAYVQQMIRGWNVFVNEELLTEHGELAVKVLELLRFQLYQIVRVMPDEALQELQRIPIWVEYKAPRHPCMCYHPSREWLQQNNFIPEKAGSIEIANAENFLTWTLDQPWMVLHELAHAYHHKVLGHGHAELKQAFENARSMGRYDTVLHVSGQSRRAYALTNDQEYFAECTEAFFGTNDFYPFVRSELKQHDPQACALLERLWKVQ